MSSYREALKEFKSIREGRKRALDHVDSFVGDGVLREVDDAEFERLKEQHKNTKGFIVNDDGNEYHCDEDADPQDEVYDYEAFQQESQTHKRRRVKHGFDLFSSTSNDKEGPAGQQLLTALLAPRAAIEFNEADLLNELNDESDSRVRPVYTISTASNGDTPPSQASHPHQPPCGSLKQRLLASDLKARLDLLAQKRKQTHSARGGSSSCTAGPADYGDEPRTAKVLACAHPPQLVDPEPSARSAETAKTLGASTSESAAEIESVDCSNSGIPPSSETRTLDIQSEQHTGMSNFNVSQSDSKPDPAEIDSLLASLMGCSAHCRIEANKADCPTLQPGGTPTSPAISAKVGSDCGDIRVITREGSPDQMVMYFIDIMEETSGANYGTVHLFGKMLTSAGPSVSVSLSVRDVARNVYLRPLEQPTDPYDDTERQQIMMRLASQFKKLVDSIPSARIGIFPRLRGTIPSLSKKPGASVQANGRMEYGKKELWFKVIMPASCRVPPADVFKFPGIDLVLGTRRSQLEALLVKRQIRGPGWIAFSGASQVPQAERQFFVEMELQLSPITESPTISKSYKQIQYLMEPPALPNWPDVAPMSIMAVSLKVIRQGGSSKSNQIPNSFHIALSGRKQWDLGDDLIRNTNEASCACLNAKQHDGLDKQISAFCTTVTTSAKTAVDFLVKQISAYDPDVVVAHEFYGSQLPTLIRLLGLTAIRNWSALSRWRRPAVPLSTNVCRMPVYDQARLLFCGRLIIDTAKQCQEILGSRPDYSLKTLIPELYKTDAASSGEKIANCLVSEQQLQDALSSVAENVSSVQAAASKYPSLQPWTDAIGIAKPIPIIPWAFRWLIKEAQIVLRLVSQLQILRLNLELAQVTGSLWDRSLFCQRAERNAFLLLHQFRKHKMLPPDPLITDFHNDGVRSKSVRANAKKSAAMEKGEAALTGKDPQEMQLQAPGTSKLGGLFGGSVDVIGEASQATTSGSGYEGGMVLEPVAGYYDTYILYLDFASLYPSIIQEFNLDFTTCLTQMRPDNDTKLESYRHKGGDDTLALLPKLLQQLVKHRRAVKAQLASHRKRSASERHILEIKQKALKLVANSIYGSLGFSQFRFYAPHIAASVTAWGRHLLMMTKERVERTMGCRVVYGDTDSIMVDSRIKDEGTDTAGYYEALEKARMIVADINKHHSKLELEIEGLFKGLLLLKKKKYAALKVIDIVHRKYETELKGIDIVRRDWCPLTKKLGHEIIRMIFNASSEDQEALANNIVQLLENTKRDLDEKRVPVEQFIITKTLTKLPTAYATPQQLPHVSVALNMQAQGGVVYVGLEVPYIVGAVSRKQQGGMLGDRCYRPSDVKAKNIPIDIDWYKSSQVLPPLKRLCQYIATLSPSRMADALGCQHQGGSYDTAGGDGATFDEDGQLFQSPDDTMSGPLMAAIIKLATFGGRAKPVTLTEETMCRFCKLEMPLVNCISGRPCEQCHTVSPVYQVVQLCSEVVHQMQDVYAQYKIRCAKCGFEGSLGRFCDQCQQPSVQLALPPHLLEGRVQSLLDCVSERRAATESRLRPFQQTLAVSDEMDDDSTVTKMRHEIQASIAMLDKCLDELVRALPTPAVNLRQICGMIAGPTFARELHFSE